MMSDIITKVKSSKKVCFIAGITVLGVLFFFLLSRNVFHKNNVVRTAPAEMIEIVNTVTVNGIVEGVQLYDVCAESVNKVSSVLVSEGDEVYEGQKLALFDVESLKKQYASSLVDYEIAAENAERIRALSTVGAVSEKELKDAEYALKKASLACESFDMDNIEAVTSPISGTVVEVNCNKGGYIMYSKTGMPAFVIEDRSGYVLKAYVKEKDISCVYVGQKADITADAIGDRKIEGIVESIALSAQMNKLTGIREIPVTIRFDYEAENPITGITGQAKLKLNHGKVLAIPREAVFKDDEGEYVYVLRSDSFEKEYITTGVKKDGYVQVLNGSVQKNDQVLTETENAVLGK